MLPHGAEYLLAFIGLIVLSVAVLKGAAALLYKSLTFLFPAIRAGNIAKEENAYRQFRQTARNAHIKSRGTARGPGRYRKAWILREHQQKQKTHPKKEFNRNFFN